MPASRTAPPALLFATAAWFCLGIVELAAAIGDVLSTGHDDSSAAAGEAFGPDFAGVGALEIGVPLIVAAAAVLTIALLSRLLAGRRRAAYLLPPISVAVVLLIALGHHPISTIAGLVLVTAGSVPFLTTRTHRYLNGWRPSPRPRSDAGPLS
ncbi:hypothetical protein [Amycolatopsis echigonensis]|uniref:Uncharacterized protein n=1 Tax=Amycolatopsis echigonensis TaxID=2576905 RepID=A0A8E1W5W4_9PSEU|nr:hypothetical protein [Amycolatopsis echigonensis]MBB2504923.1 hypothetical protein [Amycolatopsis echigonensis]